MVGRADQNQRRFRSKKLKRARVISQLVFYYHLDPRSLPGIPQWILADLLNQLPVLKAEQELVQADIVRWFSTPRDGSKKEELNRITKGRKAFIRRRQSIINAQKPRQEALQAAERVNFEELSEREKAELKEWAEGIGAMSG